MADPIPPQEVGVRALKNGLSRYLAAARDGQGKVLPPRPGPRYIPKPVEGVGPVSDLVIGQRR